MSAVISSVRTRVANAGFRYPSLFWPAAFICIGVMTWLWNEDVLSPATMTIFVHLWPLLLIGAGLDLLIGRAHPAESAALGIGLVTLTLILAFAGPALGLVADLKTYAFSEPVGQAASAQITVYSRAGHLRVQTQTDPRQLVSAKVTDTVAPDFTVTGLEQKEVTIGHQEAGSSTGYYDQISRQARIQISKTVPVGLNLEMGSGIATAQLGKAQLTNLQIATGSGTVNVDLPAMQNQTPVDLSSGSGTMNLHVPATASIALNTSLGSGKVNLDVGPGVDLTGQLTGGSGTFVIHVPADSAVRIAVASHVQRLRLPSNLNRVSGPPYDDNQGVWETPGFEQASHQISMSIAVGSGALLVSE